MTDYIDPAARWQLADMRDERDTARAEAAKAEAEVTQLTSRLQDVVEERDRQISRANVKERQLLIDAQFYDERIAKLRAERDLSHQHMLAEAKDHGETRRRLSASLDEAVACAEKAEAEVQRLRDGITALADEWEGIPLDQSLIRFTRPSDDLRALLTPQVQDKPEAPDLAQELLNSLQRTKRDNADD